MQKITAKWYFKEAIMNEKILELGETRVKALIEIGIVAREAIDKGKATDNSVRSFINSNLKLTKEEITFMFLVARFPLSTYAGCTSMKEVMGRFNIAKLEATQEIERKREEKRLSELTASEIEEEQANTKATVARTKANALNDRPNKLAGLKVDKKPSEDSQDSGKFDPSLGAVVDGIAMY